MSELDELMIAAQPPDRRLASVIGGKGKGRKLTIRDSVFARLELQVIKKGLTVSAVVDELLDRELPRHRIVTD
jgi:hypothetical protein